MSKIQSKISTELNLALNTSYYQRVKSEDLNVGYNVEDNSWELIIKYIGSISDLSIKYDFSYVELLEQFAVILIKADKIMQFIQEPEIVFVDKPQKIFDGQMTLNGYNESCFNVGEDSGFGSLKGRGVLIAIIDSGIDYRHEAFRNSDGSKIIEIWDQSIKGLPPEGYNIGTIYSRQDIDASILNSNYNLTTTDYSGHGSAVAGIAGKIAPEADLLIIKLDNTYGNGISRTSMLMLGVDYAIKKAISLRMPLVINLSFGNNYGDHSSNSIVENYLDSVSNITKMSIVVGSGNEGVAGKHSQLMLGNTSWLKSEFIVGDFNTSISLQVWRSYIDIIDIFLLTPQGEEIGPFNDYQKIMNYSVDNMSVSVINGFPTPYNTKNETYIAIIANDGYIQSGIWEVRILPKKIADGRVDIWLPVEDGTEAIVRFLNPSEYTTLTIPSTASSVITVGAYDSRLMSYAPFSGRGYTVGGFVKPDLVAPGVDINVVASGGGYSVRSGTSFATPFVTGACALMMEYGITDGNDPFLFGEKLKAYLIRGAKPLIGLSQWPNELAGWGALCFKDSLP